jgi:hypothetical protein
MENIENSSGYSSDSVLTPINTHTSIPEFQADVAPPPYHAPYRAPKIGPPYNGGTFIIRDIERGLVITSVDGQLELLEYSRDFLVPRIDGRGSHWRCVEGKNRWIRFKNMVSGACMIESTTKRPELCVRHYVSGGYEILSKMGDGLCALQISGNDDVKLKLVAEGERGTIWEFLEIEGS